MDYKERRLGDICGHMEPDRTVKISQEISFKEIVLDTKRKNGLYGEKAN
jgi:hypothetical protein